ncbi:hypothetical protein [Lysobacter fragariae]
MPFAALESSPAPNVWPRLLIWAGVAACAVGLLVNAMWLSLPLGRFGESLALGGLSMLLAWPLRRFARWQWASALAAVWSLALVLLTGVLPALAVSLLVAAGVAVGGALVGRGNSWIALPVGLALIAGVVGWLLPVHVHFTWAYVPLLAIVAALGHLALRDLGVAASHGWREAVEASPGVAKWSVMAIGLASAGAWVPTMQYDDLAYHLGLPWQLLQHGRYALDPTHQVWALAPWAGDVLQGVAQVMAREESRSALNIVWYVASLVGLWCIGLSLSLTAAMRWAMLALFASLPLVAGLLGGMQTETAATAVMVALAALIFEPSRVQRPLVAGAALMALLVALKPIHALAALPLLVWAAARWRSSLGTRAFAIAAAGGASAALIAGSSYLYAWKITGNPLLPVLNGYFRSPYFASHNYVDSRWQQGFDLALPWDMTFATARYLEGWNGGFGFVLVALMGAWLIALHTRSSRALALCATLAIAMPLLVMQYARYTHPGVVLLIAPMVLALQQSVSQRAALRLIAAIVVLNFAFQANSQWILHAAGIKRSLASLGNDVVLFERYAPERAIAAALRAQGGAHRVLDLHGATHAEFAGDGRTLAWYSPSFESAGRIAERDPSGQAWALLLRRESITDVMLRPASLTTAQRAGLARAGAVRERVVDEAEWWRIPPGTPP